MRADRAYALAALSVLTVINLLNYADRYVLAGFLPLVQGEFGKSDAEMGVLTASFLLVFSIVSPLTGVLGDRFPRKWFIGGSVVVWSLATLWSGWASSYEELLVARAVIGVGEAGYGAMAPSFIADLFSVRRRGKALSMFFAAIPVGVGLGYGIGGAVGSAYGWRAAFLVAGAPGLVLGLIAFLLREPRRGAYDPPQWRDWIGPSVRETYRTLFSKKSYLINTAGATAMSFATGGLGAWMPTFLHRERDVPLAQGGLLFGAMLIVAGFGATLLGGWLGDRLQARSRGGYFLFSGVALVISAPFAMASVVAVEPVVYWPAIFLALFCLFLNTGPLNASLVNVVPPSIRSSAVAFNVFVIHVLGDAISPSLIGAVSDASSLTVGLVINSFVIAGAGLVLFVGRGTLRRDMEEVEILGTDSKLPLAAPTPTG